MLAGQPILNGAREVLYIAATVRGPHIGEAAAGSHRLWHGNIKPSFGLPSCFFIFCFFILFTSSAPPLEYSMMPKRLEL